MADEDVILASVSTIAVAAARKRRRRNRLCWVRDFKVVLQRTFFIKPNEQLVYIYNKKCNYLNINKAVFFIKNEVWYFNSLCYTR